MLTCLQCMRRCACCCTASRRCNIVEQEGLLASYHRRLKLVGVLHSCGSLPSRSQENRRQGSVVKDEWDTGGMCGQHNHACLLQIGAQLQSPLSCAMSTSAAVPAAAQLPPAADEPTVKLPPLLPPLLPLHSDQLQSPLRSPRSSSR